MNADDFCAKVGHEFARRVSCAAITATSDVLSLAIAPSSNMQRVDAVGRLLHMRVNLIIKTDREVADALASAYDEVAPSAEKRFSWLEQDACFQQTELPTRRQDLLGSVGSGHDMSPAIRLVDLLLLEAIQNRASDVHIQPYEIELVVRMRIDGVLFDVLNVPKQLQDEVTSRVKVLGRMDIAERRLPQDGRASVALGDSPLWKSGCDIRPTCQSWAKIRPPSACTGRIPSRARECFGPSLKAASLPSASASTAEALRTSSRSNGGGLFIGR